MIEVEEMGTKKENGDVATRKSLHNLAEDILSEYKNTFISFQFCTSIHEGGDMHIVPQTEAEMIGIINLIEESLNIKLESVLGVTIKQIQFGWKKDNSRIFISYNKA